MAVQKDRVVELFFIYFLLVNSDKNSGSQSLKLVNPPVLKYAVLCSDHFPQFPDGYFVRNHKLQSGLLIKGDLGDSKS